MLTKEMYREKITQLMPKVKETRELFRILDKLNIDRGNFNAFINGNDKRMSCDKLEVILTEIEKCSILTNKQRLDNMSVKEAGKWLNTYIDVSIKTDGKYDFCKWLESTNPNVGDMTDFDMGYLEEHNYSTGKIKKDKKEK